MSRARLVLPVVAVALAVAALTCARKMLPPSPDRFAPRLQEITTRNRVLLELRFDEEIDARVLEPDSFTVTGADGNTLELRGAGQGRRSDRVELWTAPQSEQVYELTGVVRDRAGNPGRFRSRFRGSERVDTIAPRVQRVSPDPGTEDVDRVLVRVSFSEPVDTAQAMRFTVVPSRLDTGFDSDWLEDWETVDYGTRDSLLPGEVVYFLLEPGLADLEGNRSRDPAFTYFTSDSVLTADPVSGRASWEHGPLGTGVVFFHSPEGERATSGFAPVLSDGSFNLRIAPGEYEVEAVADTNHDGLVDLASPGYRFATAAGSLDVTLRPESLPRPTNGYRR